MSSILISQEHSLSLQQEQALYIEAVIASHRAITRPVIHNYHGQPLTILPNVYSPFIGPSGCVSLAFASQVIFENKRVLDIGCGSGVVACLATLSGAKRAVGTDINPEAIKNSRLNAEQNRISDRTGFWLGSLFEPLEDTSEEFDIVFANLPFTAGKPKDMLEAAFYDDSLNSIRRYLKELPRWITENDAKGYLCLSDMDGDYLPELAQQSKLNWREYFRINLHWVTLFIIELTRS